MRKFFRHLALCACLAGGLPGAQARAIWIDTDLSLGSPLREVDDAYALLLALRSPELQIVGISTTYGNTPLRGTTARTRHSLGAFRSGLPVHPGAASPNDLGKATPATAALSAALRETRLTYVALGPLTNLASFLRLHPEEAARIDQVILIAGKTPGATLGFGPQEKFRIHDANLVKDPAAVRAVLASSLPLLLTPIETSARLTLENDDLRTLAASGAAGKYLARRSGVWLCFWTHFVHARGGPIFDALAILAAARPELLTLETRYASIDPAGALLVPRRADRDGRRVLFCSGFSAETKRLLLRRLRGSGR